MQTVVAALLALVWTVPVLARDAGQWDDASPEIRHWYQSLMQPDAPSVSCCGPADAYWTDSYEVTRDGEYIAIITDDREDAPLGRPHVPVGTRIVVPNHKIHPESRNPTGHGVIFLSTTQFVYCFVPPTQI